MTRTTANVFGGPRPRTPDRGDAPPSVLLLYLAVTGSGHRRAAAAVERAVRARAPAARVEALNLGDHLDERLHDAYKSVRSRLLEHAPHLVGQVYEWYDRAPEERSILDDVFRTVETTALHGLVRDTLLQPWSVVVNTHFFAAELCAGLRRAEKVTFPHVTITTDLLTHGMWFHEPCEAYFVATEEAEAYLAHLGAPPARIHRTGIPVDPVFARLRPPRRRFEEELGRAADELAAGRRLPVVVLHTGGFSPEVAARTLAGLLQAEPPLRILAAAGANEERAAAMRALEAPARHDCAVLGYTDRFEEVLAAGDLLVGKAGGLVTSEALVLGLPLVIVNPTPDQEAQNTDVLLERGAALRAHHPALLPLKVAEALDRRRWVGLRRAAYRLGRPDAAAQIAERVLHLAGHAESAGA